MQSIAWKRLMQRSPPSASRWEMRRITSISSRTACGKQNNSPGAESSSPATTSTSSKRVSPPKPASASSRFLCPPRRRLRASRSRRHGGKSIIRRRHLSGDARRPAPLAKNPRGGGFFGRGVGGAGHIYGINLKQTCLAYSHSELKRGKPPVCPLPLWGRAGSMKKEKPFSWEPEGTRLQTSLFI